MDTMYQLGRIQEDSLYCEHKKHDGSHQDNCNRLAGEGLKPLQAAARERKSVFEGLPEAVKTHSLGRIGRALYDVGGDHRRNV